MKVFILTGAGISAESGIATFRDADGLWARHRIEDVATPDAFARNPGLVRDFYNARRAQVSQARPNAAHLALVDLAGKVDLTLVTQNVDGLHHRAGSNALEMHGALRRNLCADCGHRWDSADPMTANTPCPHCGAHAVRPDVVWFGEIPHGLDAIETAVTTCDIFAAIGTSAQVYPAAGLSHAAQAAGAQTWEFNLDPTGPGFDHFCQGPATQTVPAWVQSF